MITGDAMGRPLIEALQAEPDRWDTSSLFSLSSSAALFSPEVKDRFFERFPDLVLCAVHGGGFVPFQIGRLDKAFEKVPRFAQQSLTRPPSESLQKVYVDTIVHVPEALAFVVERMGDEHVLLGTDYPFPMGDQDPVGLVRSTPGLTDDVIESILGENAARLTG